VGIRVVAVGTIDWSTATVAAAGASLFHNAFVSNCWNFVYKKLIDFLSGVAFYVRHNAWSELHLLS
jgi:hypothetical protein